MEVSPEFLVMFGIVVVVGFSLTLLYYFSRYFFSNKENNENLKLADKTHDEIAEKILKPEDPIGLKKQPELSEVLNSESDKTEIQTQKTEEQTFEDKTIVIKPRKTMELALAETKKSFWGRIKSVLGSQQSLSTEDLEELEEVLYTSDLGPMTVQKLMQAVGDKLEKSDKKDLEKVQWALREQITHIFEASGEAFSLEQWIEQVKTKEELQTLLIVGVNGAGKTTSIGKLAHKMAEKGLKVMVAAGDTFRAAAGAQLKVWSDRAQVEIFHPEGVTDPGAVAFDACQSAKAKKYDVLLIDTAGRLHNQGHLMEELKKVKRVMQKVIPDAPSQTLIVLDANSGQNALIQAKTFHEQLTLSGVLLTKLDGSAKGGVAVGIANELKIPICMIGVGEGIEDLRDFQYREFVDSILP